MGHPNYDPDLRFQYELCYKLGGMTVAEMNERMSQLEFQHHVGLAKVHAWEQKQAMKEAQRKAKRGRR